MLSLDDNTNLYNIVAIKAEAEFMNVNFSLRFLSIILRLLRLEVKPVLLKRLGRSKIS
jgi:hypothetical protein